MSPPPTLGLALVCGPDGLIRQVLRDDLGLGERLAAGRPFTDLVDEASAAKARQFLDTLRFRHAAFDW